MTNQEKCPKCQSNTFVTKRVTLSWLNTLGALIVSLFLFYVMYLIMPSSSGGSGQGKFMAYLLFGSIGLAGWIFTHYVKKEFFIVIGCIRCDYSMSKKVTPEESNLKK